MFKRSDHLFRVGDQIDLTLAPFCQTNAFFIPGRAPILVDPFDCIPALVFSVLALAMPMAACAQSPQNASAAQLGDTSEQAWELIALSQQKWLWMVDRNVDELAQLFDEKAIFVHMSRTMTKSQELDVIRTGNIQYQRADIKEVSARIIGDTAIVLSKIELHAIVGGNVAVNPFSVTETFVKVDGQWKLGALAFSRLATPS